MKENITTGVAGGLCRGGDHLCSGAVREPCDGIAMSY